MNFVGMADRIGREAGYPLDQYPVKTCSFRGRTIQLWSDIHNLPESKIARRIFWQKSLSRKMALFDEGLSSQKNHELLFGLSQSDLDVALETVIVVSELAYQDEKGAKKVLERFLSKRIPHLDLPPSSPQEEPLSFELSIADHPQPMEEKTTKETALPLSLSQSDPKEEPLSSDGSIADHPQSMEEKTTKETALPLSLSQSDPKEKPLSSDGSIADHPQSMEEKNTKKIPLPLSISQDEEWLENFVKCSSTKINELVNATDSPKKKLAVFASFTEITRAMIQEKKLEKLVGFLWKNRGAFGDLLLEVWKKECGELLKSKALTSSESRILLGMLRSGGRIQLGEFKVFRERIMADVIRSKLDQIPPETEIVVHVGASHVEPLIQRLTKEQAS